MKYINIKQMFVTFLTAASLVCPALATPERQVQLASGLAVSVPADMQVQESGGGLVITDASQSFVAIVKSHAYASFDAFANELHLEKDGLTLVGQVQSLGGDDRCFRAARTAADGSVIADTFVRFSPYGGGGVVLVLSRDANATRAWQYGLAMAQALTFSRPQPSRVGQQLAAALSGRHLVYLYTGNGYSERKDLYLLPNGAFSSRSDASSLSMNGSGALAGGADGTWSVTPDGQLLLQYYSGDVATYTIAAGNASNEVLLNGRRYFVMND